MLYNGARSKRRAVPADTDEYFGPARLRRLRKVDDFGDVREIVAGKRHNVRLPALQQAKICPMILDLQVNEADVVSGAPHRLGNELEP
jgi:hypothetical protein